MNGSGPASSPTGDSANKSRASLLPAHPRARERTSAGSPPREDCAQREGGARPWFTEQLKSRLQGPGKRRFREAVFVCVPESFLLYQRGWVVPAAVTKTASFDT